MTCEDVIKANKCLGCNLAEQNINADNCIYRERTGLEQCKQKLEQMKMEGFNGRR